MFRKLQLSLLFIEKVLTAFSWIVTLFLTLMILVDITGRYLFSRPLPATWEIGEICMPYIVFFPFAYALTRDNHIRISLLKNILSIKVQNVLKFFTDAISILTCALMTYYSWLRFWDSYKLEEEMLAAIAILWWWGKIAMPIGMGMFTISYCLQLLRLNIDQKK